MKSITFYFTQDTSSVEFMSSATTFAELERTLEDEHGKSVNGKVVKERTTKAVYSSETTLPTDMDELVFYVHPSESKAG